MRLFLYSILHECIVNDYSVEGWIVTYIINERHGGPSSGYISSGYWGGLTVGRLALLYVNKKVRTDPLAICAFQGSPRLTLPPQIGEWRVIFLYILIVLAYVLHLFIATLPTRVPNCYLLSSLELVVWLVPDLLSSAICVSFVGFFLGPMFPIVMNHAGTILPPELITGSISWIASFGAAGSAAFPFITGAIASGTSIGSLQPL